MRARKLLAAAALAQGVVALVAIAAIGSSSVAASPVPTSGHGRLVLPKGELLPHQNASVTSLNWSGYAVTGSTIVGVTQSWVVPTAGDVPPGFSSTWAGIGGYSTSDLIQAGTTSDSLPVGGPQYYAWFEILPASESIITSGCKGDTTCAVTPGESMSVSIRQVHTNEWSIALTDHGHWTWQSPLISYASTHSSAEWILEAPTFVTQTTLADVGTQRFVPTNTFTDAHGTHTIAAGHPVSIAMGPGLVNEATPSGLDRNGQSFDVCAFAQSCATP
jgi:hypothetical protein